MIHENNLKQKISWHCPFKPNILNRHTIPILIIWKLNLLLRFTPYDILDDFYIFFIHFFLSISVHYSPPLPHIVSSYFIYFIFVFCVCREPGSGAMAQPWTIHTGGLMSQIWTLTLTAWPCKRINVGLPQFATWLPLHLIMFVNCKPTFL